MENLNWHGFIKNDPLDFNFKAWSSYSDSKNSNVYQNTETFLPNWAPLSFTTFSRNLLLRFFFLHRFIERWVLKLSDRTFRNFNSNVPSSIKWQKDSLYRENVYKKILEEKVSLTLLPIAWCKIIFERNKLATVKVGSFTLQNESKWILSHDLRKFVHLLPQSLEEVTRTNRTTSRSIQMPSTFGIRS